MSKKILVLNWWDIKNPKAGGAEVHLDELFSRLAKKGYSVTLVCSNFYGAKKEETIKEILVIRIAPWWLINIATTFWYLKHRKDFDIVVDYTNKIPYLTPVYVRKKPHLAFALHVFGDIWQAEWGWLGKLFAQIEKLLYLCYRNANMIAISQSTKKDLIQIGVKEKNIKIIYPGVNSFSKPIKNEKTKTPSILVLGRLKKYKKIDLVIKSWPAILARYPKAQLWIVGAGSDRTRLERLKKSKNIVFFGWLSEKEKNKILGKAWLLVQPSIKEGWGLTVMEAAAAGTPSLVANSPGLREAVVNNKTGWLFNPDDQKQFVKKLIYVLGNSHLRKKISYNAIIHSSKFSWDNQVEKLEKYLRSLT